MDDGCISIEHKIEELKEYFSSRAKIMAVWIFGPYLTGFNGWDDEIEFVVLYDGEASDSDILEDSGNICGIAGYAYVCVYDIKSEVMEFQYKVIKEGRLIFDSGSPSAEEYVKGILEIFETGPDAGMWGIH